jgi:hypothetical protein
MAALQMPQRAKARRTSSSDQFHSSDVRAAVDRWLCPHVFMLSHLQSIPGPRTSRSNSALQRHNSNEFTFTTCQLCGASFAKLSQAEVDQHNLACTSQLELRSNFKEIDVALKPVSFYPNHVMWDESLTGLYK